MGNGSRIMRAVWAISLIAALAGCGEKMPAAAGGSTRSTEPVKQETAARRETQPRQSTDMDQTAETDTGVEHSDLSAYLRDKMAGTMWTARSNPEEDGADILSFLNLRDGKQSALGEYDGEAGLMWLYDGDTEYQEEYEGWWRLEEADGQICLRLDLQCIGGEMLSESENPPRISDLFPLGWDGAQESMILWEGIQNGTLLPFHDGQGPYGTLTQSVG